MEKDRKIVIITDDAASIQKLAENIVAVIGGVQGYSAAVIPAEIFSGSELLPAYAFFLGCEAPEPSSFLYIETLLQHINLAGRPCGIFSTGAKTLKYLSSLVRDSEPAVGKPFLAKGGAADGDQLQSWVHGILKRGDK